MDPKLSSLNAVLERVDARLLDPAADVQLWSTGFPLLDDALGGGLRAGTLNLLAGSQGEGKTTFALQLARETVRAGAPVLFFSYELEAEVLLQKLLASEAAECAADSPATVYQVRAAFEGTDGISGGLVERLGRLPGGLDALARVSEYSDHLHIHRSTTLSTDIEDVHAIARDVFTRTGVPPLIVVDYLQKVRPPAEMDEEAAVTLVTERLKDISIDLGSPVLAISAADRAGLEPGQRMRARNLKGSTALAYEADVVLILANKADIVARHHLMYSANNGEHFRNYSVLTVEKNRSGRTGAEVEFLKQFASGRFVPEGKVVSEDLVDERVFTE